jgi:hypothetical protein
VFDGSVGSLHFMHICHTKPSFDLQKGHSTTQVLSFMEVCTQQHLLIADLFSARRSKRTTEHLNTLLSVMRC